MEEAESKVGCLYTCAVIFTMISGFWELCGAEGVARRSPTEVLGARNFHSREDRDTRQESGGDACAGVGQKMGVGRRGKGREVVF